MLQDYCLRSGYNSKVLIWDIFSEDDILGLNAFKFFSFLIIYLSWIMFYFESISTAF